VKVNIAMLGILIGLPVASAFATDTVESREATVRGQELRSQLDQDVPKWLTEYKIPSVSIAHIEAGRIILAATYGAQSPSVPATPDTLYNIASMTKPISAEVILRLVSKGQISLDEPMYPHWVDPDVANDERHKLLTPRLALSHQTGFPNWRYETGDVLKFLRTPGEAYGYSGEGYEYVARYAEKKTGKPFEELAQTLIFGPAGMKNTAYTGRPWFAGRVAVPIDADGTPLKPSIPESFVASDDLHTTASEYATFMLSVMRRDGLTDAVAKDRETIQRSRKAEVCPAAHASTCPEDVGPGLGWEVYRFKDGTFLMHTGNDRGSFTFGYFSPTHRTGTVIFTNISSGGNIVLPILDRLGKDPGFVAFLHVTKG
jgi:CubicO group peptidase (beta-lactamase class C family)